VFRPCRICVIPYVIPCEWYDTRGHCRTKTFSGVASHWHVPHQFFLSIYAVNLLLVWNLNKKFSLQVQSADGGLATRGPALPTVCGRFIYANIYKFLRMVLFIYFYTDGYCCQLVYSVLLLEFSWRWCLLVYQAVSTSKYIPKFSSVILPLFSGSAISRSVSFCTINRHFFELYCHEDVGTTIHRTVC
jgi:hypothetical protein